MPRKQAPPRRVITKRVTRGRRAITEKSYTTCTIPSHDPPTRVFTSDDDVRGEYLHLTRRLLQPATTTNHTHVIFLPGNPGVIEYYRPTIRCIFDRLPRDVSQSVDIHALGLPGHDVRELNGLREFSIADHVAYMKSYLSSARLQPSLSESRLIVIGHSYGSYLGVRLLEELGEDVINRSGMILLMPALWEMGECAGGFTRFLAADRLGVTTWGLWGITASLPALLRDGIVRAMGHGGVEGVTRCVVDGRRRGLYRNVCVLARDEMVCIKDPNDRGWCREFGKRCLLVWADDDKWCSEAGKEVVCTAFQDIQVLFAGSGVRHGFVTSRVQTEIVARAIVPWICERVRGEVLADKDREEIVGS